MKFIQKYAPCFLCLLILVVLAICLYASLHRAYGQAEEYPVKVIASVVSTSTEHKAYIGDFDQVVTYSEYKTNYEYTYEGTTYTFIRNGGHYSEDKVLLLNPEDPSVAVLSLMPQVDIYILGMFICVAFAVALAIAIKTNLGYANEADPEEVRAKAMKATCKRCD